MMAPYVFIFITLLSLSLGQEYQEYVANVTFMGHPERIFLPSDKMSFIQPSIYLEVTPISPVNHPFKVVMGWSSADSQTGGDVYSSLITNHTITTIRPCLYNVPDFNLRWSVTLVPIDLTTPFTARIRVLFFTSSISGDYYTSYETPLGTYRDFHWDLNNNEKLQTIQIIHKDGSTLVYDHIDQIVASKGHCYSGSGTAARMYSGDSLASAVNKDREIGLPVKELTPGRWWISFRSTYKGVNYTNSAYAFKVNVAETCLVNCTQNGECIENPAYCKCRTWWDGEDCQYMFKGAYVLIAWSSIFFTITIIVLGRTVWVVVRTGLCSGNNRSPNGYNSIENGTDSDEGEETRRLIEEPDLVYKNERTSHVVRRQLSGEDEKDDE